MRPMDKQIDDDTATSFRLSLCNKLDEFKTPVDLVGATACICKPAAWSEQGLGLSDIRFETIYSW